MNPPAFRPTPEIAALLESFPRQMEASKQTLAKLLAADAAAFCTASLDLLKTEYVPGGATTAGARYLTDLLAQEELLVSSLLDRMAANRRDAIELARWIAANGNCLPPALENTLAAALREPPYAGSAKRILCLLDLFAAASAEKRLTMFQTQLMAYPEETVQSKTALLVGSVSKSASWVGRHVRHQDARVQANAVEALWTLSASDSRTLLAAACGSPNNRVAGNAALGLYRLGDVGAIRLLLEMAQREDSRAQLSGLWAIGQTEDPRFLPFLMERFGQSKGRTRLAITRALAHIRRREKIIEKAGSIQIRVSEAQIQPGGRRKLAFALWCADAQDLSAIKPTEFALWEGDTLIQDYDVRRPVNADRLAAGFVAPCFFSLTEPYADAIADGLSRCLRLKRPGDLWRMDRFSIDADMAPELAPSRAPVPEGTKIWHGFLSDHEWLDHAIHAVGTSETDAPDAGLALERLCHAIGKHAAQRHGFVFLDGGSNALEDGAYLTHLRKRIEADQIVLHGFAPASLLECAGFERLCRSMRGGTFTHAAIDQLPGAVEQIYAHLLSGFEISYCVAPESEPGPVKLRILSDSGTGQAEFAFDPGAATAAAAKTSLKRR